MEQIELQRIIEAILFAAGERVEVSRLATVLEVDEDEIVCAVDALADELSYNRRGIRVLRLENGYQIPNAKKKTAFLIEKGMPTERLCEVMKEAQEARAKGEQILVSRMNKNKKFQKEQLMKEGYNDFKEFYKNPLM